MKVDLSHLSQNWKSPIIARERVGELTGGGLKPRHLANLDCRGLGPPGRFRMGKKVCYDVEKLLRWLEERSEAVT